MKHPDIYSIKVCHVTGGWPIAEIDCLTLESAGVAYDKAVAAMRDRAFLELTDDFGIKFAINGRVIGWIFCGWLKDFHKRVIDIGDTQQANLEAYESEFGSKVGIGR